MTPEDLSIASPYLEMYNIIMVCKNLGVQADLSEVSWADMEVVHEFYTAFEETSNKTRTKGK